MNTDFKYDIGQIGQFWDERCLDFQIEAGMWERFSPPPNFQQRMKLKTISGMEWGRETQYITSWKIS